MTLTEIVGGNPVVFAATGMGIAFLCPLAAAVVAWARKAGAR